jgi:SAM-dependent methyltransferase
MVAVNAYSPRWFDLFLRPISAEQTEREAAFLTRQLPLPPCRDVLDLCCGVGRHARALVAAGYRVTGLDRDPAVLAEARRLAGGTARYVEGDMRHLNAYAGAFDAVVCLWQSFGYFDDATNAAVLQGMAACLRPGGRLILDLYHRGFFAARSGERRFERDGVAIVSRSRLVGERLTVELAYAASELGDRFEWRLYTPDEIVELADAAGLRATLACADFREGRAPSEESPRMQLVFERVGVRG